MKNIVVIQTTQSQELLLRLAQVNPTANPEQGTAQGASIAVSDSTPLGPYSSRLKDAFEASRPGKTLQLNESKTPQIVAIARSLTPEERAQGLQQQPVTREKIALIMSAENPLNKSLSLQQVTDIFRGNITNWSQVGGADVPIRVINRASSHPVRQALGTYKTIQPANLALNDNTGNETTATLIQSLGKDGISYAPASEVIEQVSAKIIAIDGVSVDDSRYPFSLPLNYVYRSQPVPAVKDFLAFLSTADAQSALKNAQSQASNPILSPVEPQLSSLISSQANVSEPSLSTPVRPSSSLPISVTPLEPSPSSLGTLEGETNGSSDQNSSSVAPQIIESWIPLVILAIALGLLGWLTYMRTKLEQKQKLRPRPAPNYVARLNNPERGAASSNEFSSLESSSTLAFKTSAGEFQAGSPNYEPIDSVGQLSQGNDAESVHQDKYLKSKEQTNFFLADHSEVSPDQTVENNLEHQLEQDNSKWNQDHHQSDYWTDRPTTIQEKPSLQEPHVQPPNLNSGDKEEVTLLQGIFTDDHSGKETHEVSHLQETAPETRIDPLTGQPVDLQASSSQTPSTTSAPENPPVETKEVRHEKASMRAKWTDISDPWEDQS